jgi:hypothetical protein
MQGAFLARVFRTFLRTWDNRLGKSGHYCRNLLAEIAAGFENKGVGWYSLARAGCAMIFYAFLSRSKV